MKYIKNVTSKKEPIAYENENGVFRLHLINKPKNIEIGERILLYQNVEKKEKCFTHIVEIVATKIHIDPDKDKHSKSIDVKVIKKGKFNINSTITPLWLKVPHGGYTSGSLVAINNLKIVKSGNLREVDLIREAQDLFSI